MDEPKAYGEFRSSMLRAIERYRELHSQTKNPMYVWRALYAAGSLRQLETGHLASDQPLLIPGWCADYFTATAWDIDCLSSGMDQARQGVAGKDYPKLTSDAAMKLIPQALGLTRQGYSAFDQAQSTLELMQFFNRYEELRSEGRTSAAAVEALMSEFDLDEERTVRRRIAAGRRYAKGERPEEKDVADKT